MKWCPGCYNYVGNDISTCDCGYEFGRPSMTLETIIGRWLPGVVLGLIAALALMPLTDHFPYRLLISDDEPFMYFVVVFEALFLCFLIRYINPSLRSLSTILTIAVMTFGMVPFLLFLCLILACWGNAECF